MSVENRDLAILGMLQKDAKISAKKIGEKLDLPTTTIYSRIKKLEENDIIQGYTTRLNTQKLGWNTTAYVFVSALYTDQDTNEPIGQREIAQEIAKHPEVQEVHIISGDWDLLVKLRSRDVANVGDLVIDKIRAIKGVRTTLTSLVFSTVKDTDEVPI